MNNAFDFLCLALRVGYEADDPDIFRARVAAMQDWSTVVSEAREHRVVPLVFDALRQSAPAETPPDVLADLRRLTLSRARIALVHCGSLAALSIAFQEAGVRMLAFKGVTLSAQLYGDPSRREAGDIDLLVDPADIVAADAVLTAAGYRRLTATSLSPQRRAAYMRWRKDFIYVHSVSTVVVELHHRLHENPHLIHYGFGALWSERETVEIGNVAVPTLPQSVLSTYLCVHGAQHFWRRLRWLADFRMLLARRDGVQDVLAKAKAEGFEVLALQSVLLAHEWLGLPIPEPILASAKSNPEVASLHRRILGFPFETTRRLTFSSLSQYLGALIAMKAFTFRLRRSWPYRARFVAGSVFRPEDGDAVGLPDRIFWMYPALRPVMWIVRSLRRVSTPTNV